MIFISTHPHNVNSTVVAEDLLIYFDDMTISKCGLTGTRHAHLIHSGICVGSMPFDRFEREVLEVLEMPQRR